MPPSRPLVMVLSMLPATAHAGMPMLTLSDAGSLRLSTISFFLVLLLGSAWGLRALWNQLAEALPRLPRIGFKVALGLVVLWGLVFVLVLTMISGARELMTPGAWEKRGATYALSGDPLQRARHHRLEQLRDQLWRHAEAAGGALPLDLLEVEGLDPRSLDRSAAPYVFVPGGRIGEMGRPVLYEPAAYGDERLVLLADGRIERWSLARIHAALEAGDG